MISRCPDCHFMAIVEDGCKHCGFKFIPLSDDACGYCHHKKEANDPKDKASDTRKVERPAGGHTQPPAGQLSLNLF